MIQPLGHPALLTLMRLKLRGALRRQWRRTRSPFGAAVTILGVLLLALWMGVLLFRGFLGDGAEPDSTEMRAVVRLGALLILALSISGSLNHRGLYVPREEIERLLSAPIRRSDLIRYRLLTNAGRAAFGAVVLGMVIMQRMPMPLLAFAGVFLALETLPVLGQMAAILSGVLEKRIVERFRRWRSAIVLLVVTAGAGLFYAAFIADELRLTSIGQWLVGDGVDDGRGAILGHPAIVTLTLPFEPWARMITAADFPTFLRWLGVSVLIWGTLFEITARLPFDFRELSLETSASVAERIQRLRRGGGAAAGEVSRRAAGWRIPWLFGRGPLGALAWRKTGSIVRKARGTLVVSTLVIAFVTILSTVVLDGGADDGQGNMGPMLVAVLGLFYLAAGLRFDFRDELERMEAIKAWPLEPSRVFVAMLLPEVLLVSGLLVLAVLARALLGGGVDRIVLGIVAALPLIVLAWVALDNAVFLLLPVRFTPGQDGAIQNAGRGMIMLLLRLLMLGCVGATAAAGAFSVHAAMVSLGAPSRIDEAGSFLAAWMVLLTADLLLIRLGGRMIRRFDVARDRG